MRLAVSNIAWAAEEQDAILAARPGMGVAGLEIAPTMIWPGWEGAVPAAARDLRRRLEGQGLAVPALQAILFARPELRVFGDATGLVEHVARVAELAGVLGAGVMVFGSPRNRLRGDLAPAAAMDAAVPVFRAMAAACQAAGTILGIEANPQEYGGDFLTRWREAAALVERVGHPGVVLHLDTACTALAGEDPVEAAAACAGRIGHFHVSAPQLGPVEAGGAIDHPAIAAALRTGGYGGWVSIEMRRTDTPLATVRRAVEYVKACYA